MAGQPSSGAAGAESLFKQGNLGSTLSKYSDLALANLPAAQKDNFGDQTKLFALYEKMIRSGEFTFEINPNGFGVRETVNLGE